MSPRIVPLALATLALAALISSAAERKRLEVVKEFRGSVGDLTLQKEKPKNGVVVDEKAFAKLWKAWGVKGKMPKIDFDKHLVLVATSRGSRLTLSAVLDDKGDLRALALATRDLRPGFRYHIIVVSREGVKTVNGKELK
jgi:hypothetical protein